MLKTILDNMGDIVAVFDMNGVVKFVTPSYQKILGYDKDELTGHNAFDYIHPDDRERVILSFSRTIEGDSELERFRFRNRDGRYTWFDGVGRIMRNADGSVSGVVVGCRDITESMRAEEALRESEERFSLVSRAANDAILEKVMVLFIEELEIKNSGHADPARTRMVELELFCKDGAVVPFEGNFCFLRDSSGKPTDILAILRDITERKLAEKSLSEIYYSMISSLLPCEMNFLKVYRIHPDWSRKDMKVRQ
jgi:PAS domain S-box-containing protein